MDVSKLFPSKYLQAQDAVPARTVTLRGITQETMKNRDGKDETKPVLRFDEFQKGMVLNKTNAATLSALFGKETDNWIGERVTLGTEDVPAFGEIQPALRFRKDAHAEAPSHDSMVKRYQTLYEEARVLNIPDLETYVIAPDALDATIIELGKDLRSKVEAAKTF
jgi:hypothetical protein